MQNKATFDEDELGRLLPQEETSEITLMSPSWLEKARLRGDGPPYVRIGRKVAYPEKPLRRWLRERLQGAA